MKKSKKDQLIKARVSQQMKNAVIAAAAEKGEGGEAEAIVVREALGEYLVGRGYLSPADRKIVPLKVAEPSPKFKAKSAKS